MSLVDSHCHIHSINAKGGERHTLELWSKLENATTAGVVERAKRGGVTRLITVGCDLEDSRAAINLAQDFNNVWATIGIHPHEANKYLNQPSKMEAFGALINEPKVVAIGECGLDYFYNHSNKASQAEVLAFQLELAAKNRLPVIFHVRNAFADFWPILANAKNIKGVLHSYTDSQANLDKALSLGLKIGVNGIATFTKDPLQTSMYKTIPLSSLLLETDSPYLTPVPFRGTINEPKNVTLVAEYLAALRAEDVKEIADQTTKNARKLFNI